MRLDRAGAMKPNRRAVLAGLSELVGEALGAQVAHDAVHAGGEGVCQ